MVRRAASRHRLLPRRAGARSHSEARARRRRARPGARPRFLGRRATGVLPSRRRTRLRRTRLRRASPVLPWALARLHRRRLLLRPVLPVLLLLPLSLLRALPVPVSTAGRRGLGRAAARGGERAARRERAAVARGGRARELRPRAAPRRAGRRCGGSRRTLLADGRAPRRTLARGPVRQAHARGPRAWLAAGRATRRGETRQDERRALRPLPSSRRLTSFRHPDPFAIVRAARRINGRRAAGCR